MKKLLTLLLTAIMAVACCFGFTACGEDEKETNVGAVEIPALTDTNFNKFDNTEISSDFKLGVLCLHDENSTYDKNFIDAVKRAKNALGLKDDQVIIYTGVPEGAECETKANELASLGCKAIFADSFGHEDYIIASARKHPEVQYFHATGTKAHTENLSNYHNAFASIYQGRYLAGVAGGLKLQEMINNNEIKAENKDKDGNIILGYVGAYTYAEVISGFTSWYLGVKSVVSNVVMKVQFTGSWYDEPAEKTAAETLISKGAALVSQHADSMGAPNACESKGVPNVSYNGSTLTACPDTFIISSKIDWTYYFKWIIASVGGNAESVPTDFAGSINNGCMVALSEANGDVIADGTVDKLVEVRSKLMDGSLKVFDCSKFTVNGEHLTSYEADVNTDAAYTPDTQVIKTDENGVTYFAESEFRSAPYFNIQIDGIEYLNTEY